MSNMDSAKRGEVNAHADAGINFIAVMPEYYTKYLEMQANNLTLSPTNIAVIMSSAPEFTKLHTAETWTKMNFSIIPDEESKGVDVFLPIKENGNVTITIGKVYDISQLSGVHAKTQKPRLENENNMLAAIGAFVRASKAPIDYNASITEGALYDPSGKQLFVNPEKPLPEIFSGLCSETVYANKHFENTNFSKDDYRLEAESIAYIAKKYYLGEAKLPDISGHLSKFEGMDIKGCTKFLESGIRQFKDFQKYIDKGIEKAQTLNTPAKAQPEKLER